MVRWIALITIAILMGNGCDKNVDPTAIDPTVALQASNSSSIFADNIATLQINVFYEANAVPYTGNIGVTANQTWSITKSSFDALFQSHAGRFVSVPTTISQMKEIAANNKASWNASELIDLGLQMAPGLINGFDANISVIFVKGNYQGDANVLGIHFGGYPFAFVFKDVVVSVGGDSASQRYVEQATVVHELGHVVGLVNNGVPMATLHEDPDHAKHSSNSACVMYWAVESKANILSSLANAILGNKLNLFGAQSLQDGRGYHP